MNVIEDEVSTMDAHSLEWPTVQSVLCNPIILEVILGHLDFKDMKNMRSTCCLVSDAINKSSHFRNKFIYVICRKSADLEILNKSDVEWKNIKLELYAGIGEIELFYRPSQYSENDRNDKERNVFREAVIHLLQNHVESLNLSASSRPTSIISSIRQANDIRHPNYNRKNLPLFTEKLNTPLMFYCLKSLAIHIELLNAFSFRNTPILCEQLFKGLKSLNLYLDVDNAATVKRRARRKTANLAYIAEFCNSLTEFRICRILETNPNSRLSKNIESVICILRNNAKNLLSVDLEDIQFWKDESVRMGEIKLLSLKHLKVRCRGRDENRFIKFLRNQPFLQSLVVDFSAMTYRIWESGTFTNEISPDLPMVVLHAIQEMGMKLRKLHIRACELSAQPGSEVSHCWEFLRHFKQLEDFSIIKTDDQFEQRDSHLASFTEIWSCLPKTLKRIHMEKLKEMPRQFSFRLKNDVSMIYFENLTFLSLLRCDNSLLDADLQNICLHMTKLLHLEFSHCPNVTDFGVTGIATATRAAASLPSFQTASLSNIKGLKKCSATYCGGLTAALHTAMVFEFLIELNLGQNLKMKLSPTFVASIIKQNPRLEKIVLSQTSSAKDNRLMETTAEVSTGRCAIEFSVNEESRRRLRTTGYNEEIIYYSESSEED